MGPLVELRPGRGIVVELERALWRVVVVGFCWHCKLLLALRRRAGVNGQGRWEVGGGVGKHPARWHGGRSRRRRAAAFVPAPLQVSAYLLKYSYKGRDNNIQQYQRVPITARADPLKGAVLACQGLKLICLKYRSEPFQPIPSPLWPDRTSQRSARATRGGQAAPTIAIA